MDDVEIISISRRAVFDLKEARRVLPVIRRVTQELSGQVEILLTRLEGVPTSQMATICELENKVNEIISQWHEKIRKLGAHPKGLWLVDFDFGEGYYCWKYPEPEIMHWHGYNDRFTGRKMIEILELHEDSISPNQPNPGSL